MEEKEKKMREREEEKKKQAWHKCQRRSGQRLFLFCAGCLSYGATRWLLVQRNIIAEAPLNLYISCMAFFCFLLVFLGVGGCKLTRKFNVKVPHEAELVCLSFKPDVLLNIQLFMLLSWPGLPLQNRF